MWLSKSRLVATGLAAAAVAGVAALTYAAVGASRTLPRLAAERGQIVSAAEAGAADHDRIAQARDRKDGPAPKDAAPIQAPPAPAARKDGADGALADKPDARATRTDDPARKDRDVRVTSPNTAVDVDRGRGKVRVRAPYTKVDVDPDRGQVRVRAPYVNLDIRW